MSGNTGYKNQQSLSLAQFLTELPSFIVILAAAIFSRTLIIFVDLLDSLGYIIRNAMIICISRKLSKDLRFEYNYGVGKIEAISSLFCDGIMLFGVFLTLCLSAYSIIHPSQPSDYLIIVVGWKLFDVLLDLTFFLKQRKILKIHSSSIYKTNDAAAFGSLMFDGVSLISLLAMWLLRGCHIGGYISPVVSIFIVVYLTVGCIKRIKAALGELTDKTLPEEQQMKILSILTRYYNSYSQFYSINSHKSGDFIRIDLHLSFEKNTSIESVVDLKKQLQKDFGSQFGSCIVNIIMEEDEISSGKGLAE